MNLVCRLVIGGLLVSLCSGGTWARAQETVVISKSRLEELERKEAELERLKRELRKMAEDKKIAPRDELKGQSLLPATPNSRASAVPGESASAPNQSLATNPPAPVVATLPPLTNGLVVAAVDLMQHYLTEPVAAAKRYESARIHVTGEIAGFDKPLFGRHAVITLRTRETSARVVCRLDPPENLPSLFTAKNGEELVGSSAAGARSVLARIGQRVVVEGWCQGRKGQGVSLTSVKLISVE